MEQSIFRKSSLERLSSPEQLNDYIRVTNPGVWLVLAAEESILALMKHTPENFEIASSISEF